MEHAQTMQILISLSVALLAGLMLSRLAKRFQLPAVTAYLLTGVLLGPYLLGAFGVSWIGFNSLESVEKFSIISDVALGFIAFSIGNEFRLSQLKQIGKQATIVGIFQAVVTTLLVDIVLVLLHLAMPKALPLPVAITLGAIASATAPAATLMVVRQYKAKGPLTDILLPVVALDDAVGLVLFSISFGIAKALALGVVDIASIVLGPIFEVVFSLALGATMGGLFTYCERFFHSRSKRLAVSIGFVMLTIGISFVKFHIGHIEVEFSSLLSCMMLGTIFCNFCDFSEELMERVDRWTAPLFVLFFVFSGAELELSIFGNITSVIIGIVYILARSAGKYLGAYASSKMSGCSDTIVKYLGVTLLPQAGVALGMAMKASELGDFGTIISNITLFAVLIYELVGPMLTKIALTKAGEIDPEGWTSARHEHAVEKGLHKHIHKHNEKYNKNK